MFNVSYCFANVASLKKKEKRFTSPSNPDLFGRPYNYNRHSSPCVLKINYLSKSVWSPLYNRHGPPCVLKINYLSRSV